MQRYPGRLTARQRAEQGKLDQFQLTPEAEIDAETLHSKAGGVLVPIRDYNTLSQLEWVVAHTPPDRDIVVLTGVAEQALDVPQVDENEGYLAKYGESISRMNMDPAQFASAYSVPIRVRVTRVRGH